MPRIDRDYERQVLLAIASGRRVTQRALSNDLGVALGLANVLVRRLVAKGFIKVSGLGTRDIRYQVTPSGTDALAQATEQSLEESIRLYTKTREGIAASLAAISQRCAADGDGRKPVVFFGAGDVAEIAYVSLQSTDLTLVGVVDEERTGRFFDIPISPVGQLSADALSATPFSHLIVTSLSCAASVRDRLAECGVPAARVSCLSVPLVP